MNKFAPKRIQSLIDRCDIDDSLTELECAPTYFITNDGTIYREYQSNKFYRLKNNLTKNGYLYSTLIVDGKHKSFRNHILVAKTFIENPENLPLVGHKDNNKTNNVVSNLYWTTNKENVQKAVDDGLLVNDKGEDDSQSFSFACFDINHNFIRFYGSAGEIHRDLKVSKSTVLRQANHQIKNTPRCNYYFRFKEEYLSKGFVL